MSRWRITLVALLIAAPFVVLAGLGSYWLWYSGLGLIVWWPMAGCMVLGYVLGWYWQHKQQLLRPVDFTPAGHWTDRDRHAWQLIEARAKKTAELTPDQLSTFQFYTDTAQELAQELARFYHPHAKDPIASLTIPEILAVIELAAHDLAELVDKYLPGGHLLTVQDWRRAKQISDWYQTASNVYWLISALYSPLNTGLRFLTSQMGMSRPFQMLQQNLIAWFYTAYLHRVGTYLIEVNSGRLRIGARRYQELRETGVRGPGSGVAPTPPAPTPTHGTQKAGVGENGPQPLTVLTVIGQVKTGKSSFINALLGEQRAFTDVLPATGDVTRYDLQPSGIDSRLVILDTVGYGHAGPKQDQLKATEDAAQQSDLILLVLHARNPARQPDADLLRNLRAWFASRPDLKMPPVLGILTHIDLLSPAMEWSPPYDWTKPQRPKEQQIEQAWTAVREQLGDYLVGLVPLCTAPGKIYGIDEWFLPTLAELLDEARAVALLRCIRAEANTGKVRKLWQQLLEAGRHTARVLWQSRV
jgi:predicted GTPase